MLILPLHPDLLAGSNSELEGVQIETACILTTKREQIPAVMPHIKTYAWEV
jgi:hypothetical protein